MKSAYSRLTLAVACLSLAAVVGACQPEDAAGTVPQLVVRATDFDYPDPATAKAGLTEVTIDNQGKELHQVVLFQLKDGKTVDDFAAYMKTAKESDPPPSWAVPSGGPAVAAPGMKSSTFVALEEGTYAMVCNIPDAKGVPHSMQGMLKPLTVMAAEGASAAAPDADVSVKMADFNFTVSEGVKAGHHVLRASNEGKQLHEAVLVKLNEGATAQQVADTILANSGPPPGLPLGGVVAVAPGTAQSFPADMDAGRYAFLCFFTDPASGKPHVSLGMLTEFDVQ